MDCSQAHPLSLDEKEAHLQSRHISLSSHPLSVIHSFKDKHTLLVSYAHVATGFQRFGSPLALCKNTTSNLLPKDFLFSFKKDGD